MKVIQIYNQCKQNNTHMLSDYQSDFWQGYIANYNRYDNYFTRQYGIFSACFAESANDFINQVFEHLLLYDKQYSELYRIQVIDDDKYSLTNNYDMTEKMERTTHNDTDNFIGAQSVNTDNVDTGNTVTNEKFTDSTTHRAKNREDEQKNFVRAADNTEDYIHDRQINITGPIDENTQTVNGERVTKYSGNKVTNTTNTSDRSDNIISDGSENYTLTRIGNIGVMTATDMLRLHKDFWTKFEFYAYIFKNIADELLFYFGSEV